MWAEDLNRLALLELLETGQLRRRKQQAEAWDELSRLGWGRRAARDRVLLLDRAEPVAETLDACWPSWRDELAALRAEDLRPDPAGWDELARRRRAVTVTLPERVNRRIAAAALGPHSKSSLARADLAGTQVTGDVLIRLRPNPGLLLRRGAEVHDAAALAHLLGELVLSERALLDGTVIEGTLPRAVLLVENLGPYLDLPCPDGWLVGHVPGWNTRVASLLQPSLGAVPWIHFGDLDTNGVRIVRQLRTLRPDVAWFVPSFWADYVATHALPHAWPDGLVTPADPPLLHALVGRSCMLEQEVLALDPRLESALESALQR